MLNRIPMEGVCDECSLAFFRNVGFLDAPDQPTKH
jgi:hypothetical protein